MQLRLFPIIFLALSNSAAASPPEMDWWRVHGDTENDGGHSIYQTADGGYVIAGQFHPPGDHDPDMYVLRLDANGEEIWSRTYGDAGRAWGICAIESNDGGIVATGYDDTYLVLRKFDADGYPIWSRDYGTAIATNLSYDVEQTSDDGYAIYGTINTTSNRHQVRLLKTSANGHQVWSREYGGEGVENGHAGLQTSDGGYLIVGSSTSFGTGADVDFYMVKTNADGIEQWHRTHGRVDHADYAYSVAQALDGGYVLIGTTIPVGSGVSDLLLVKTDADGVEEWRRIIDRNEDDHGRSIQVTRDGGFLIGAITDEPSTTDDIWMFKTNADGITEWEIVMGGPFSEHCMQAIETADEGFAITGYTQGLHADPTDVMVVKYVTNPSAIVPGAHPSAPQLATTCYPNPCATQGTIAFDLPFAGWTSVQVFDRQGRSVGVCHLGAGARRWCDSGRHRVAFDRAGLPSGVYLYRVTAGTQVADGRLVLSQ